MGFGVTGNFGSSCENGHEGNRLTLGSALFHAILAGRSSIVLSQHEFADTWSLVGHPDRRIHLAIPEML
jgi:hypothetical protein